MMFSEALLPEFDLEVARTRKTLARVPADKVEYAPHAKSMPMGKLAAHVAQLTSFGLIVLTAPQLDLSAGSFKPLTFVSAGQIVNALDEGAAKVRAVLIHTPDEAWGENWKLAFEGKTIFEASRLLAYRAMFLNHTVHHRAQLGVYLRLNGVPVPATYGPSADEPFTA